MVSITNGEWIPFLGEKIKNNGLASQIVQEAFESESIKVKWGFFPWKRSFKLASLGTEYQAGAVWTKNPERAKDFLFSKPVIQNRTVFFYHKDFKFNWSQVSDLKRLISGFTAGYFYSEEFKELVDNKKINIVTSNTDSHNFLKLRDGIIQIFPVNLFVGLDLLKNMVKEKKISAKDAEQITYHPKVLQVKSLHLIFPKSGENSQQLLEAFNRGLEKLEKNGRVKELNELAKKGFYSQD